MYYWKIQLTYKTSLLSMYTSDDDFPIPSNYRKKYDEDLAYGEKVCPSLRVIIVSMVRDVIDRVPMIIKKCEFLGKIFDDYRVLIVENDSKDGTREALLQASAKNPRIEVLGCGINKKSCSLKTPKTLGHGVERWRIEKMVKLRNVYMDRIREAYSNWDYSIFWDLDVLGSTYVDGVQHSLGLLERDKSVDAMCAYGIYKFIYFNIYYDTYATLAKGEAFCLSNKPYDDIRKELFEYQLSRGGPLVEVDSCFSGFTIYRLESILHLRYDMSPDDNIEGEQVRFNRRIRGKKVINPSMINFILLND